MASEIPSTDNTLEDLACFTCEAVNLYHERSGAYMESISETMLGPMKVLFLSIVGLWMVLQGLRIVIGTLDIIGFFRGCFFLCVAWILLNFQSSGIILAMFNATIEIMGSASSVVLQDSISASTTAQNESGLTQLAAVSEQGMRNVLNVGWAVASSWTITNPLTIIYGLLLIIPYFLLMIIFFSHVVVGIFRVMIVSGFAPFLLLAFGFDWGREMFYAGLRTLLSSILVLFSASLALGSIMYGVTNLELLKPGADISELAHFGEPEFLLTVILGWMGTAFMTEAVGMANSITGSALSNTSVGILTAGIASSVMAVASRTPAGAMMAEKLTAKSSQIIHGGPAGIAQSIAETADKMKARYLKTDIKP